MKEQTLALATHLENVIQGQPWFGRAVFELLEEVDETRAGVSPGENGHSMLDLLYHMITWASFAEQRILGTEENDQKAFEKMDWRPIDPKIHNWQKGVSELRSILENIIDLLRQKEDDFLSKKVDYREYDFHYLITGVTEHTIYHLGQISYLNKFLG